MTDRTDITCPYCGKHAAPSWDDLHRHVVRSAACYGMLRKGGPPLTKAEQEATDD